MFFVIVVLPPNGSNYLIIYYLTDFLVKGTTFIAFYFSLVLDKKMSRLLILGMILGIGFCRALTPQLLLSGFV